MTELVTIPVPINQSEAIIEPFWDQYISNLPGYTVNKDLAEPLPAAANPRALQFWCWATLKWDRAPVDRPIITFERTMNVDVSAYDTLIVRIALPAHVHLTIDVAVDGVATRLAADLAGASGPQEYELPIKGKRLQWLKLTLTSGRDQADEAWLYWIGLAHGGRRTTMLSAPNPYDDRWEGWLLPPEAKPDFAPRFGFFFDAADLPAIRKRAASAPYRPLMDLLRQRARRVMAFHKTPEDQIGDYVGFGDVRKIETRPRDWDTHPFHRDAPLLAFVGLIDQDPEMSRFAARIAVSVAHCRTWRPHHMQDFPGSTWDIRAFPEAQIAGGVALALDWAGGWFTDAGEHLLRYAVTHKALGRIRGIFLQYDYMWDCNQSHMIAMGRLLALLVQLGNANKPGREGAQGWKRVLPDIDQFERDLYEMIDRYIQADGSTHEGVNYWSNSFRVTLPVLAALAKLRGKPLREMIPPKMDLMWSYVAPMLSTAGEPGSCLTISDAVFQFLPWDAIGVAAACLPQQGWRSLLGACLSGGKTSMIGPDFTFDGPFTIIYGPDRPAKPAVEVPTFQRLPNAGMITSNRPWNLPTEVGGTEGGHTVRLHLVGAMANAGHCHPDKGSFILEACGETFAGDRGVVPYEDTRCRTLAAEVAHNLAVPEGCFQINPSPVAAIWQGDGDELKLNAEIDSTGAWQAPVRVARRRIASPQPDIIEITDEIELDEARAVTFYINSSLPITAEGAKAVVQGQRARMTVEAGWAANATAGEYYCNSVYAPYNRLCLTSQAAKRHVLRTMLRLEMTNSTA
jgi:Heparinase II/III-like protein